MQILIGTGGVPGHSLQAMLVPICAYVVMAISLNLTVGVLGELSPGPCGLYERGRLHPALSLRHVHAGRPCPAAPLRLLSPWWSARYLAGHCRLCSSAFRCCGCSGDYLAIVTLAFGEIIKKHHQQPVCWHWTAGPASQPHERCHAPGRRAARLIIGGPMGVGGVPKISTFARRLHSGDGDARDCLQPGEQPCRTRHYGRSGQPHCGGERGHQHHQV